MPRPILLAWELGAGRGHIVRLVAIARALAARGFTVTYAVERLESLRYASIDGNRLGHFQAPLWPGLLGGSGMGLPGVQASFGDTLADLGLRHAATVEYILSAWETVFLHARPAAIVADFSPLCLLAARGRVPSIATGNGYTLPPAHMPNFPIIRPDRQDRKYDEAAVLETVNGALAALGRDPLDRLPAIFSADRTCLAGFVEIDPYAQQRRTPHLAPFIGAWDRTSELGEEIFVYLPEHLLAHAAIVAALENVVRAGWAVRLHVSDVEQPTADRLAAAGIAVEKEPVPLDRVSRRARLIVSHGGHGTTSFALAAGIPQVVIAFDTEKLLTGQALERLGAGRCLRMQGGNPLEGPLLAQAILETVANEALAAKARSLAPDFLARLARDPAEQIADEVEKLLELQPCSTGGVP